jgi:dethiobiotin synthetase
LRAGGQRTAAMKPIETGESTDAILLARAAGKAFPLSLVRPIALPEPLAPLVAARRAHVSVNLDTLDEAFRTLCASSEAIVVEGAGGLLVPITETETYATLFKRWKLELVIVAANRLGVINHTLLTVRAAQAEGIPIRAVVLNSIKKHTTTPAERTNLAVLKELLLPIPVVQFPYAQPPHRPSDLAAIMRKLSMNMLNRTV